MVLVCGLVFLWDWFERSRTGEVIAGKMDRYLNFAIGGIAVWLMYLADSKTSMVALLAAGVIIYSIRMPAFRRHVSTFGAYLVPAAIAFFLMDRSTGFTEFIVTSLGRDMTFTGRTEVWRELLNVGTDPIFGTGYHELLGRLQFSIEAALLGRVFGPQWLFGNIFSRRA